MAKKDIDGRLQIPTELIQKCRFFKELHFKGTKLVFFINEKGEVGIAHPYVRDEVPNLIDGLKYLGDCNFNRENNSINIPKNVDTALGEGNEYYFAIDHNKADYYLYIYKKHLTSNANFRYDSEFLLNFLQFLNEKYVK